MSGEENEVNSKNSKLDQLRKEKVEQDSRENEVRKNIDTVNITEESTTKIQKKKIELPSTEASIAAALGNQDIEVRNAYIGAITEDIKSKAKVRRALLWFYLVFTSLVTIGIFWVIVDPITLMRDETPFYQLNLKLALSGAFFANVISIIILMIRYSFAPVDNMISAFKDLSKN